MLFLIWLLLVAIWCWLIVSPFYWRRKGVPTITPLPVVGNFLPAFFIPANNFLENIYYKFPKDPYVGIHLFTKPTLFLRDPKLVSEVCEEKFLHFSSRGVYANRVLDPASRGLFHTEKSEWKLARNNMSPAFSPIMVKQAMENIKSPVDKMVKAIERKLQPNRKGSIEGVIEMLSVSLFFSVDATTYSVFGVESSIFNDEKNSIFYNVAKEINNTSTNMKMTLSMFSPAMIDIFKFTFLTKKVNSFIGKLVQTALKIQMDSEVKHKILLNRLVKSMPSEIDNVEQFMVGQGINLFAGSIETTAHTLTFLLHELSKNLGLQQEIRNKLGTEEGGKLIRAAIFETLRIYPVIRLLTRRCTQRCKLSTGLEIDEGTLILVPVACLHSDPDIHPEPREFNIHREYVKGAFLPFGIGPRGCIGMRMAIGVLNEIVTALLKNYEFTPSDVPVILEERKLITAPKGGLHLNVRKIST